MQFSFPLGLLLFLFLPIVFYLGRPRRFTGQARGGPAREWFALFLRIVILTTLILAMAGLEIRRENDRLAVVFILDISDSVPRETWEAALDSIESELTEIGPDDLAGLIVFGGDALVERALSSSASFDAIQSAPRLNDTNIAGAIRLAQAVFPTDYANRIVLFSDGFETVNNSLEAAGQALLGGIDLVINPYPKEPSTEVLLTQVTIPAGMVQGDRFNLVLGINATHNTDAEVRVFANGSVIKTQTIQITRGEKTYTLPLEASESGFIRYTVQVSPQIDNLTQNNELSAYSLVTGAPTLLLIVPEPGDNHPLLQEPRPDEGLALEQALSNQGFQIIRRTPSLLPNDLAELGGFEAVVLVDVPADALTERQMQTIEGYVRDLGGGLIVVGGPTSFGVGGYYQTPLERTLPVEMRLQDDARKASVTIAFVIDQSGSMADISGGASKLDLAKEATIRSIQLMFPDDRVGVVSFDDAARWVVPFTALSDRTTVTQAVGRIRSAGGTDILAGLEAVARELPGEASLVRHIVLLTDGGADPTGIPELVDGLKTEFNITLTTIGVGQDAAPYLPDLANIGGGRYHFAANPASIPSIFTLETTLVSRAYLVEEAFFPAAGVPSPILAGITEVPQLHGYVATSPKATARVVLTALDGEPLLATWRYGLGTAAAFTSDASGRWGRDWVTWDGFNTFWGQMVNFVLSVPSPPLFDTQVVQSEGQAVLTLTGRDQNGNPLNEYRIEAVVTDPDLNRINTTVEQVAPGLYEGTFAAPIPGVYLIHTVAQPTDEQGQPQENTFGWVRPYPAEYRTTADQVSVLEFMVAETGARLRPPDPWHAFSHDIRSSISIAPAWTWLLLAASLLLPLDIAVRRISIPGTALTEPLRRFFRRREDLPTDQQMDPARSSQLASLTQAKARAQRQTGREVGGISDGERTAQTEPMELEGDPITAAEVPGKPEDSEVPDKKIPPASGKKEEISEPSLASELLARKHARKKKR